MEGCRWVDKVVCDVPYSAQVDILDNHCIGRYELQDTRASAHKHIDFVVHGDDIAMVCTLPSLTLHTYLSYV